MDFKESLQVIKINMEKDLPSKKQSVVLPVADNLSKKPYNASEQEAIKKGFEEVEDSEAYNGRYFIKDGLIWIHNIEALKSKLGIHNEDKLRYMNYDVDTYYDNNYTMKTISKKLRIHDDKDGSSNCAFDPENMVYLSDGVYIHKSDCWF